MKLNGQQTDWLRQITDAKAAEKAATYVARAEALAIVADMVAKATRESRDRTNALVRTAVDSLGIPKTQVTKALMTTNPSEVYNRLKETQAGASALAHALPANGIGNGGNASGLAQGGGAAHDAALAKGCELVDLTKTHASVLYTADTEADPTGLGLPTVVVWARKDDGQLAPNAPTYYPQASGPAEAKPYPTLLPMSLYGYTRLHLGKLDR